MTGGAAYRYRSGPLVWAIVIASTCLVLFLFQKILWLVVPFLLALVIYYLLLPIQEYLVLRGVSRVSATNQVSLGAFAVLGVGGALAFPWLAAQAVSWQESAMRYLQGGLFFVVQALYQLEDRFDMLANAHVSTEFVRQVAELIDSFAGKYLGSLAMGVVAWTPLLLLSPFIAYFMLRDGSAFRHFLIRAVPNAFFERTLYLFDQVDRTARLYFQGLLTLTVLDALCLAAGLWWLGVSGPFLLGVVTAVLAWIPYVGSVLGCLLVVLVAATDFPDAPQVAYGAIVLFIVVRLLDDFLFMPLTVGRSLKLHPLLTVVMIFVGGAVAGISGLMLVLPVLGVIMVLGETIGRVVNDPRLMARHLHARQLRQAAVSRDLY